MKNSRVISSVLAIVAVMMVSIGMVLQDQQSLTSNKDNSVGFEEVDIKNMAMSANETLNTDISKRESTEEVTKTSDAAINSGNLKLTEVTMETAPASIIVPPRVEVYEGMTMDELAAKLNRNLGNGYIAGKGYLVESTCIQMGVDPYVAVAIMLHETGCSYNCSSLVRNCNNVGGQKGAPGCGGGSYKAFPTLDDGIKGFVENLHRNYYAKGYTTVEAIGPRYAESNTWVSKINGYVSRIRAS